MITIENADVVNVMPCTTDCTASCVTVITNVTQSINEDAVWIDGGGQTATTSSVSVSPDGSFAPAGTAFYVSGSSYLAGGLTGSLTQVAPGVPFLVAGTNVGLSTNAAGQVTISAALTSSAFSLRGAFASRPAAGLAGRVFLCTDAPFMYFDDGTSWQQHGPVFSLPAAGPSGSWAGPNFNLGASDQLTSVGDSAALVAAFPSGLNSMKFWGKGALANTSSYAVTVAFVPRMAAQVSANDFMVYSLVLYASGSGKMLSYEAYNNGSAGMALHLVPWSSPTSRPTTGSVEGSNTPLVAGSVVWLRVRCLGNSQYVFENSADGQTWVGVPFNGNTSSPTEGGMTHYGVGMYLGSGGSACSGSMVVMSLQQA